MTVNLSNQRPGDLWVINGDIYEVVTNHDPYIKPENKIFPQRNITRWIDLRRQTDGKKFQLSCTLHNAYLPD